MNKFFSILILIGLIVIACSKEKTSIDEPTVSSENEELVLNNFQYLATTPEVGALGRVLFYDKNLSKNGTVSCGSCHHQSRAFADNSSLSVGFNGELTSRNTPPIQNLTSSFFDDDFFQGSKQALFWDGRTRDLRDMVFEPTLNHIEMGLSSPSELITKIRTKGYYNELFNSAFGSSDVTIEKISEALGGFVASLVSQNSRFEFGINNSFGLIESFLSPEEIQGFNLFVDKYDCSSCHNVSNPIGYSESVGEEFVNIGLDAEYADPGRSLLTDNSSDDGKFKIPNLRNVALTAPYMHDGRFETLEEVIDHYSTGVVTHQNLDARLRDNSGQAAVLNITDAEKSALIAFLNTLTDHQFITDPAFSDPFSE